MERDQLHASLNQTWSGLLWVAAERDELRCRYEAELQLQQDGAGAGQAEEPSGSLVFSLSKTGHII